ncbi:MAG TPA: phytanoyl-CoA dioxygenase family protein [Chloroflexota bacterium]
MQTQSPVDVEFFRENGYYLYHHQLFSPDKLNRLRAIFEEQLAQKGDALSDELDTPHFRDPRLLEFLLSDEVADLVEPIVGPNIALFSSHFICKDPFTGRATPWHEDSAFWEGRFDGYDNIVTVWLAIDPSTRENGCMRVLPGTHTNGFSEYEEVDRSENTFDRRIANLDERDAVYFELQPGELSLHDSRIIHGAEPNRSPIRRCGYTMRYFPTSLKLQPEKNKGWKIWLVRGKDQAGNTYENA